MNIEDIRNYCLLKKGVTEGFPFDEETLVFKAGISPQSTVSSLQ